MTERELIDDILYRIEADQHGMIDWIDPVGRARLAAPLEAANARIRELQAARDRPWTYRISIPDGNPTWPGCVNYDLRLVDTGYSDRVLLMESKEVNDEIASLREAVRVLAKEVSEWHRLCIDARAWSDTGRIKVGRMRKMLLSGEFSSNAFDDAVRRTQANPIARAAIEAAKEEARNG